MKQHIFLAFLTMCSCANQVTQTQTSQPKQQVVVQAEPKKPAVKTTEYFGAGWKFSLPNSFVRKENDIEMMSAFDPLYKRLVFMNVSDFQFTLEDYTNLGMQFIKDKGYIPHIDKYVFDEFDGKVMYHTDNKTSTYDFFTIVNGRSYHFSCTGLLTDKDTERFCRDLADNIKLDPLDAPVLLSEENNK